eukprot:COSAG01_NODE_1284_length_10902_cov_45.724799_7_plen_996_part_01
MSNQATYPRQQPMEGGGSERPPSRPDVTPSPSQPDCAGVWGGSSVVDECGVCAGDGSTCISTDCAGVPNGLNRLDNCGACDSRTDNDCVQDCAGVWGGSSVVDACQVCGGDGSTCISTDCAGVPNGLNRLDNCGACDSRTDNDCVQDCAGVWGGSSTVDACQVCGGDGSTCSSTDCAGVPNGLNRLDDCGTCDSSSDNDCVQDCAGVWGGSSVVDACQVCGGDGSTCTDCAGVPNGLNRLDDCGTCDSSSDNDCVQDCAGVWGGSSVVDAGQVCGGNCTTTNLRDEATTVGACAALLAAGLSCADHFSFGANYQAQCNLECEYDLYDSLRGMGQCQTVTHSSQLSCATHFGPGMQYEGYCDFTCGFCNRTAPPPPPAHTTQCVTYDWLDSSRSNAAHQAHPGSCAYYIASGAYSCNEHFHGAGNHSGLCNLACELNLLEHPAAYGLSNGSVSAIASHFMTNLSVNSLDEMIRRMAPGLCQQLIEADANICETALNAGAIFTRGLCDFACGVCQVTDDATYVSPQVQRPHCRHPGDCCSTTNSSDYGGDHSQCASVLSDLGAAAACNMLFAPDRRWEGQCDLACDFCVCTGPNCTNPCDSVYCGAHGSCQIGAQTGTAECVCDRGYVGGSCQFTTEQCTAGAAAFNSSCCHTLGSTVLDRSLKEYLLATSTNFWDHQIGDGECAAHFATGESCAEFFAPGRPYEGTCDFSCGYCEAIVDSCANVTCSNHGTCHNGTCVCDAGYLGSQCSFTETACTTTQACCTLLNDPGSIVSGSTALNSSVAAQLLAEGSDLQDTVMMDGIMEDSCEQTTGGSDPLLPCALWYAPGRDYAGHCDFACGYCQPTCTDPGNNARCRLCSGNRLPGLDVDCRGRAGSSRLQLRSDSASTLIPSDAQAIATCCVTNVDDCASHPCQNGVCTDGTNTYMCGCYTGWSGSSCATDIDECVSVPCLNGASCVDGNSTYTCSCAAGFSGANCATNVDECGSSPCQQGSRCVDGI